VRRKKKVSTAFSHEHEVGVAGDAAETAYQRLRAGERTGRPLGDGGLTHRLEAALGRRIHGQKPGPKPGSKRTIALRRFLMGREPPGMTFHSPDRF
jgi:hypothetical protein